jgi:hypothetical protein
MKTLSFEYSVKNIYSKKLLKLPPFGDLETDNKKTFFHRKTEENFREFKTGKVKI